MLEKVKNKIWWIIASIFIVFGFLANGTLSTMLLSIGGWILGWNIGKKYIEKDEI